VRLQIIFEMKVYIVVLWALNHVILKVITALSEEPVAFVVRARHFITVQHLDCVYSYRLASIAVIDGLK